LRYAIDAHDLTKRFPTPGGLAGLPLPLSTGDGGTLAVDHVTIRIRQGEIFGLVGPNGAGKTTLVKMLATLIQPTSGKAVVNGLALSSDNEQLIKASIGLVTGNERSFYPRLSCRENLRFFAGLHNLSPRGAERRIGELSDTLGLDDVLGQRFDRCSTGMKHRLSLARSLLNGPRLLFLDEPTRSLDPLAAARFRHAIRTLADRDSCSVFLVTHDLDEAVELCPRVGVMVGGRVRITESPEKLRQRIQARERCRLHIRGFTPQMATTLLALDEVLDLSEEDAGACTATVGLALRDGENGLPRVIRTVMGAGGDVNAVDLEAASWEDTFDALPDGRPVASSQSVPESGPRVESPEGDPHWPDPSEKKRARQDPATGSPLHTIRKSLLFLGRDFRMEVSYRLSFLLQLLGILFSSASFYFVAQLLGESAAPQLSRYGGDYFSFVLIGIAFVGYQGVALYTFSRVIRSAQTQGTLEALLVTPTPLPTILLSSSLWSFIFASLRVVTYLLVGALVFSADLGQANVVAGLVVLLLTIATLSGIGILSASFIMVFKRGSPVNFVIGSLSSLLGGVYYPVEVLPGWLQTLARFFPLTYSLEAMRRALLAGESLAALAREVTILTAFAVALLPLGLIAFRLAVRQAKRDGSLAHF